MKLLLLLPASIILSMGTINHKPVDSIGIENKNRQPETTDCDVVLASGPTLILDHVFTYNNPMVNYTITVRGEVPISEEPVGKVECCHGKWERIVGYLSGSGIVTVTGKGSMSAGQFQVKKINYTAKMRIQVNGKTACFEEPESHCLTLFSIISLEETWLDDMEWEIETSDPENDSYRYEMFKRIVPTKIPDSPHTGRTLKYQYDYPGVSIYEHNSSAGGQGTYKWKYAYVSSNAEQYYKEVNLPTEQLNYDDDRPKPKDYPVPEGELGPPLESVSWDLVGM